MSMSNTSLQDYDPGIAPLSLFRKMNPVEKNAAKTLCDTPIGSEIHTAESMEMSDHEAKHGGSKGITDAEKRRHKLNAEHIENNPDYMPDTASVTTDGRSTWTSTYTAEYFMEKQKEPQSAEEDEEASDANEDAGEEREKSEERSIVSDGDSSSCDRYSSDSTVVHEDKDQWEECPNPKLEDDDYLEWDAFAEIPWISDHEINETSYKFFRKVFKVFTYIVIFAGIMLLTILSKGSVIMAVSKLRPYPSAGSTSNPAPDMQCHDILETYHKAISDENGTITGSQLVREPYTTCVAIPRGFDYNGSQFACLEPQNRSGKAENATILSSYYANECVVSRIYWAWCLYLMICTPYAFICLRGIWRLTFKSEHNSRRLKKTMLIVLAIETIHSVGLSLLVFLVFPSLDNAFQVVMFMLGVSFLPGSLKILIRPKEESAGKRTIKIVLGILAVLGQLSAISIWPIVVGVYHEKKSYEWHLTWSIPLSLLLISVRWWENFVDNDSRLGKYRSPLTSFIGRMQRSRIKVQFVASLWKMAVTLIMMMVCISLQIENMDHGQDYDFSQAMTAVFDFDLR